MAPRLPRLLQPQRRQGGRLRLPHASSPPHARRVVPRYPRLPQEDAGFLGPPQVQRTHQQLTRVGVRTHPACRWARGTDGQRSARRQHGAGRQRCLLGVALELSGGA